MTEGIDIYDVERQCIDLAAHGNRYGVRQSVECCLVHLFGDEETFLTDPVFRARVTVAKNMIEMLNDEGWVQSRWDEIHSGEQKTIREPIEASSLSEENLYTDCLEHGRQVKDPFTNRCILCKSSIDPYTQHETAEVDDGD